MAEAVSLRPEEFRERLRNALAGRDGKPLINPYTGHPVREEDSPGNYAIETMDGANRLYYYDINGARIEAYWSSEGHKYAAVRKEQEGPSRREHD